MGGPGKQLPQRFSRKKEGAGALGPGEWSSRDIRTSGRTETKGWAQGSSLPLLMVEGDGRVTFLPYKEVSSCGPHPQMPDPPSSLELGAKAYLFMAKQHPGLHDQ